MNSRIRTRKKRTKEQTPNFSTAPAQPMFQSRSFVVPTQQPQASQQQPNLKTSLMRAERYGHHLRRMQPTGVSALESVQPKQRKEPSKEKVAVQRVINDEAKDLTDKRKELTNPFLDENELVELIVKKVQEIEKIDSVVQLGTTKDDVVTAMAEDFAHKENNQQPMEQYKQEAKGQMELNKGRGFTDYKSRIWLIDPYPKSDLVHECVHVLSAKGGLTKIQATSNELNEGFTQYFTKEVCKSRGIEVKEAYKTEVEFVEALANRYGKGLMIDAYFRGEVDRLWAEMVKVYGEKITNGVSGIGWSEKQLLKDGKLDEKQARTNILKKLGALKTNVRWLQQRVL